MEERAWANRGADVEVERKIKLDASEVTGIIERLSTQGLEFSAPQEQKDVYYKEAGFRDKVQGVDGYIVRIRYSADRPVLNMKRLTTEPGVWREIETPVDDGAALEKILMTIGVEHAVNVTKRRRAIRKDELEIILDDIEELGTYLELAVEGENVDVASASETINDFLNVLSLSIDRVEYRGYPTILLEDQGVVFAVK
jgi:predicted adenylyl cyclase CyaB